MKKMFSALRVLAVVLTVLPLSSCGYTTKTKLPRDIQSIYVETALNKIPIIEMYSHQPGLEMDITNAVIRRFQVDGNLKVKSAETADAILSMDLKAYEQEGVRFNPLENVAEYRLFIVMSLTLKHRETGEVIWTEPNFSGNEEYFVTQIRPMGQRDATEKAVENLAMRIVDRVTEDW